MRPWRDVPYLGPFDGTRNIAPLLSDNNRGTPLWTLNVVPPRSKVGQTPEVPMPRILSASAALILALLVTATAAEAACYADYKARRERPYGLAYGVMQLSDDACNNPRAAEREVTRRLRPEGWRLLGIVSIFGPEGLDARRGDAGDHFLRY